MYKLKLLLLPVAWLLAFMALACAPPDDDDAPSSGPTINNAIYDVGTALLTLQGTDLSPTEAQIQTIRVGSRTNGVAFSSYTADDPATGPDSNGLAKGKYRIANDGTALWLRLTDQHKAVLQAKVGSNGLKKGLLSVSSGAWAGLNTPKDLDVSNVPENKQSKVSDDNQPSKQTEEAEQVEQAEEESRKLPEAEQAEEQSPKQNEQVEQQSPKQNEQVEQQSPKQNEQAEQQSPKQTEQAAITGATYNIGTVLLTVQGTQLGSATQAQIQTIKVAGVVLNSYAADAKPTGPDSSGLAEGKYRLNSDGTAIWLYLTDDDKTTLEAKPGMDKDGLKKGLLSVGTGAWAGLDTAKDLAVSVPAITHATYDSGTAVLVITGTNLPTTVAVWDFSKLRFVSGNGRKSAPLLPHNPASTKNFAKGSAASATSLTITLKGTEIEKANAILVKNGESDNNGGYNLEAAAGFAGGRVADTSNPITVSGYKSYLNIVAYFANTGVLQISGRNLPETVAEWDFSKLTLVSGNGKKKYLLPKHSTTGENTATGSRARATGLDITLSGTVKAEANTILVKNGVRDDNGAYNLEAAAGFVTGSPADTTNSIVVTGASK